ncbi:metallophosphoesterase [Candidatus Woesearchaeota archaeon]|nr:metallophosphoesterase [Candidatus Woesearchaeota archaeon]
MNISEGIKIVDLALYLERHKTLVIGDVHLGFEEAMNRQGVLLPRFQYRDTVERLGRVFDEVGRAYGDRDRDRGLGNGGSGKKLKAVVVNGDLKHEFGVISEQEWRDVLKFLDLLLQRAEKVVLIKGNHDIILSPIARKRNIEVQDHYFLEAPGSIYISHGHKIPEDADFRKAKTIIMGNEHPAVTIRDGARAELFKCFLKGKWKGRELIAMPSFNQVTIGTDVLKEKFISPFLKGRLDGFEVFVVDDRTYRFGKLGNLKQAGHRKNFIQ